MSTSIDPKTVAIGGALVVAGVGAYLLLGSKSEGEGGGIPIDPKKIVGTVANTAGGLVGTGIVQAGAGYFGGIVDGLADVTGVQKQAEEVIAQATSTRQQLYTQSVDPHTMMYNMKQCVDNIELIRRSNDTVAKLIASKALGTPLVDPLAGQNLDVKLYNAIGSFIAGKTAKWKSDAQEAFPIAMQTAATGNSDVLDKVYANFVEWEGMYRLIAYTPNGTTFMYTPDPNPFADMRKKIAEASKAKTDAATIHTVEKATKDFASGAVAIAKMIPADAWADAQAKLLSEMSPADLDAYAKLLSPEDRQKMSIMIKNYRMKQSSEK